MSGLESAKVADPQSIQQEIKTSAGWKPWVYDLIPALCMDFSLYVSFFAIQQILKQSGVGPELLGTTFMAYSGGYIVFCPLITSLVGRFRSLSLLFGLVIGMLCLFGLGFAEELWQFQCILVALSFSTASFWPSFQNIIGDDCQAGDLPRRLGFFNLGWTIGKASGLILAGILTVILKDQIHLIFWLACALTFLCWLIFLVRFILDGFALKGEPKIKVEAPREQREVTPESSLPFFVAALCVNYLSWGGAAAVIAQIPEIGLRLKFAPEIQGLLLAVMVLSQFASFYLLKRWRGWIFNWKYIAGPGLVAGFALFTLAYGSWLPFALLSLGLFGVCIGFTYCASIYYALCPDGSTIRTGIHEATLGLGGVTLPLLFGLALDYYPQGMIHATGLMAGVFMVVSASACGLLFVLRRARR